MGVTELIAVGELEFTEGTVELPFRSEVGLLLVENRMLVVEDAGTGVELEMLQIILRIPAPSSPALSSVDKVSISKVEQIRAWEGSPDCF